MKRKKMISIDDFNDKKFIQYSNNKNNTNNTAIITHYLHNIENGSGEKYKAEFNNHFEKLISYKRNVEEKFIVSEEDPCQFLLYEVNNVPFPSPKTPDFKFIDLFAGIGGFRIALQNLNGKCIFSSEWDEDAKKTYKANFGEVPFGDITRKETKQFIPDDFDILCAGFPCQAFSIAGRRGGFEDTRGTLFFEVADIILKKQPQAFFLENVKGLVNHDRGRTLETILNVLRNDLGYHVPAPKIINAKDFGVPQNRERIFIVGFRDKVAAEGFSYPKPKKLTKTIHDILEEKEVSVKYYLSHQYLTTLRAHKERHAQKGNGFGFEIKGKQDIANAIVVGGMGKERNLIIDKRLTNFKPITNIKGEINSEYVRRMTPREWARLQGFPNKFKISVSDTQAYKQFGNSVAIPAIQATTKKILQRLY